MGTRFFPQKGIFANAAGLGFEPSYTDSEMDSHTQKRWTMGHSLPLEEAIKDTLLGKGAL
jgi:hypothetical protein